MDNQSLVKFLRKNYACRESLKWLESRDLAQAWAECERWQRIYRTWDLNPWVWVAEWDHVEVCP
jgi:hypothetical protein